VSKYGERLDEQLGLMQSSLMEGSYRTQALLRKHIPKEGGRGTRPLSPLLANVYLNPVDWLMHEKGYTSVRCADDIVILCESEEEALAALEHLREWMGENALRLTPEKTRMADMSKPKAYFEFLGYQFYRTPQNRLRWFARPISTKKLRSKVRPLIKRCNGHSMDEIIRKLNPILCGWFEYFKHSLPSYFKQVDGWVRMRLRSILQKRHKGRGRGGVFDQIRWSNAYFWELGLFSLVTARDSLRSSASRETINRRAVCGRSACLVRRAGRRKPMRRSYLYQRLKEVGGG